MNPRARAWSDPSPHTSHFAKVNGVRLSYLDWGGAGEALVLIPGIGDSPHPPTKMGRGRRPTRASMRTGPATSSRSAPATAAGRSITARAGPRAGPCRGADAVQYLPGVSSVRASSREQGRSA